MAQKSILYVPILRFTASEESDTHKGTKCVDLGGMKGSNVLHCLVAPFDCEVKYIDRAMNSIFFQSKNPVLLPNGKTSYLCFRCAHMDDREFNTLNMRVSPTRSFLQGEVCYYEGTKGNVGRHIHIEFGLGTYVLPSGKNVPWKDSGNGNYTISTSGGAISINEACYLHPDVFMRTENNKADSYVFKYSDNSGFISADTYVSTNPSSDCLMNLTANYYIREFPGGPTLCLVPKGTKVMILEFLPYKHSDGFYYYRAKATVNGETYFGYMQYDPSEVYPSGTATHLSMKITQPSRIRTSMNTSISSNIVRTMSAGSKIQFNL